MHKGPMTSDQMIDHTIHAALALLRRSLVEVPDDAEHAWRRIQLAIAIEATEKATGEPRR